jgi:hypothetical protein
MREARSVFAGATSHDGAHERLKRGVLMSVRRPGYRDARRTRQQVYDGGQDLGW